MNSFFFYNVFYLKYLDWKPTIITGWNSDTFDMPYLYYRICNVCGKDVADMMSPLYGYVDEPVKSKKYSDAAHFLTNFFSLFLCHLINRSGVGNVFL